MRKDDPKIQALSWFLSFISADLDSMIQRDFLKLTIDGQYYFRAHWPLAGFGVESNLWPIKDSEIYSDQLAGGELGRENLKQVQAALRNYLRLKFIDGTENLWGEIASGKISFGMFEGKATVIFGYKATRGREDLEEAIRMAKLNLSLSLCDIPREAIKICPECGRYFLHLSKKKSGRYFLHLSKKKRTFCEYKCTTRAASRRRRENDPKAYKESQRKLMWERYGEKVKKKYGGKVKVQRRKHYKIENKKKGGKGNG
jgi:hypothetical protein